MVVTVGTKDFVGCLLDINSKGENMAHDEDESEVESESESESQAEESEEEEESESESEHAKKKDKKKKKHKKEKKVKKGKKDKKKKKDKPEKEKKEKKEKKGKSGKKRGPKGAQWMTWKIPYQDESILGQAFKQAAVKGGVDLKKLKKFIEKAGGNPVFIIRGLRKGHSKGWKWDVDDSHGRLRVSNYKVGDKKWTRE